MDIFSFVLKFNRTKTRLPTRNEKKKKKKEPELNPQKLKTRFCSEQQNDRVSTVSEFRSRVIFISFLSRNLSAHSEMRIKILPRNGLKTVSRYERDRRHVNATRERYPFLSQAMRSTDHRVYVRNDRYGKINGVRITQIERGRLYVRCIYTHISRISYLCL